jgi:kynurenine 3-monooxygenase
MQRVIVVGGGLVGCAIAMYLARRGVDVTIYERNADPRRTTTARPSINLTLCTRGLYALEQLGLREDLQRLFVPLYGRMIHASDGGIRYQRYTDNGDAIYCVSRRQLAAAMLDAVERRGIPIQFDSRVVSVEPERAAVVLRDAAGGEGRDEAACIVAADGSSSTIRHQLQRRDRFDYSQRFFARGYKELRIEAQRARGCLDPEALHIWPRREFMALAFPNNDGSFTCSAHLPFSGEHSFERLGDAGAVRQLFARAFPDLADLMPSAGEEFVAQTPNSMVTIRCRPWAVGRVLLLGDAAHALLPSYGQGANAGLEDCQILDACLDEYAPDWARAFSEFEARRRPDTDAMASLCERHFVELSEDVDDVAFQARCRLESELHARFGDRFMPLYSMITFSLMPYATAVRRAALQRQLLDELMRESRIEPCIADDAFVCRVSARIARIERELEKAS